MKQISAKASAKERKRRASAALARAKPKRAPSGIKFVSFRDLTPAERARGKELGSRAAQLLAEKSRKVAMAH
jgi:hypothetical protein